MKKSGAEVERLPIKLRRETKPYFVKFFNYFVAILTSLTATN